MTAIALSTRCIHCDAALVRTVDAVGRPSKKGPQCPRCDRISVAKQGSIPEQRGMSQAQWAPKPAPATLPKNRPALVVLPAFRAFVEVPERPAPLPSKYVPSESEIHPKDLPADHPRRIAYREKLSAKQRSARARKREALLRPTEAPTLASPKPAPVYGVKRCAFCGKEFQPSGPRSLYCEACR